MKLPAGRSVFAPSVFFIAALILVSFSEQAFPRQPIIDDGKKTSTKKTHQSYSNESEGFSIEYPRNFSASKNEGGIIAFSPKNIAGFRFIPTLCVSKYYILDSPDIGELLNQIEAGFTGLPFYRLASVSRNSKSEMVITREFVDNNSKESVYEVALYKKKGNDLFEAAFQVPKKFANSAVARSFSDCLESFRLAGEVGDAAQDPQEAEKVSEAIKKAGLLASSGKYLDALSALRSVRTPGRPGAEIFLIAGRCHIGLGDYEKACKNYRELVAAKSDSLEFRNLLVDSLILAGRHKEALLECRKALEIKGPDNDMAAAFMNLGNVFLSMKKNAEALNSFQEGILRFPRNARLHNNAAIAALAANDAESAAEHYEKAVSIDPAYRNARLGLARLYLKSGNTTAADFHFNELLKLDPRDRDAYKGLLKVFDITGAGEKRKALLETLRAKDPALYNEIGAEKR